MSAIATITIADGKGTPANHVFNPIKSGERSLYRTSDGALPLIGQETIQTTVKDLNAQLKSVVIVMGLPALETATAANSSGYTAAPKVAYENKVKIEFFLPNRGLPAQRTDLRVLLKNLLTNAAIIDLVDNLVPAH